MGIKGIYSELGPGERVSLARLAVEKLATTGRPLRLAIDFSIWQFQARAATGGANPVIRTFFYRCVRLLGLGIHAVFVTDGPHKPQMKRNKRSGRGGDAISSAMGRELITLFGFMWHQAPGEAEAEAALMQQMGLVDAVLTEDVDAIMFGCTETMRGWSSIEGKKTGQPTHVTLYRTSRDGEGNGNGNGNKNDFGGIDCYGMVLVAMMSGGDYQPEGIPGCGIKIACDAARAGFGRRLCMIRSETPAAFRGWRKDLAHELRTNESGFFRSRHTALTIPSDFPSVETLQCYTHPVVSRKSELARAMRQAAWGRDPDIAGLRTFAERTFDWGSASTTARFINLLAPSMLVHRLLMALSAPDPHAARAAAEALIHKIGSSRTHASVDGLPELRVAYVPAEVVKIDSSSSSSSNGGGGTVTSAAASRMLPFSRDGLAMNRAAEEDLGYLSDVPNSGDEGAADMPPKQDPSEPQLTWVLESILEMAAPNKLTEARVAAAAKAKKTRKGKMKKADKEDPQKGAMEKYIVVTKRKTKSKTVAEASPLHDLDSANDNDNDNNDNNNDMDADVDEPVASLTRKKPAAAVSPKRRTKKTTKEVVVDDVSEVEEVEKETVPAAAAKRSRQSTSAKVANNVPVASRASRGKQPDLISLLSETEEDLPPKSPKRRVGRPSKADLAAMSSLSSSSTEPRTRTKAKDSDTPGKKVGKPPRVKDFSELLDEEEEEPGPVTKRRKSEFASSSKDLFSCSVSSSSSSSSSLSSSALAAAALQSPPKTRKSKQATASGSLSSSSSSSSSSSTAISLPRPSSPLLLLLPPPLRSHKVCPRILTKGEQDGGGCGSATDAILIPSSPLGPASTAAVAASTSDRVGAAGSSGIGAAAAGSGRSTKMEMTTTGRKSRRESGSGRGRGLLLGQLSIMGFAHSTKRTVVGGDGKPGRGNEPKQRQQAQEEEAQQRDTITMRDAESALFPRDTNNNNNKLSRIMVPSQGAGAGGFCDTMLVSHAAAPAIIDEYRRLGRAAARLSDVSVVDLTGA